ncbi:OmpA family protein [Dactylosporangium sp. NPDC049525]|uniref:OmpA family protein n=1 Tax=Dactylosporangium sp. NPDC049525 TaxID=3154730 RepID=UPI003447CC4B
MWRRFLNSADYRVGAVTVVTDRFSAGACSAGGMLLLCHWSGCCSAWTPVHFKIRTKGMDTAVKAQSNWVLSAVMATAAVMVVGCGSDGNSAAESGKKGEVTAAQCADAAEIKPGEKAETTALVVDNTASAARGQLPPAVQGALKEAQVAGNKLVMVAVHGAGEAVTVGRVVALDPRPGVDSQVADNARKLMLECVGLWVHEDRMLPTAAGSDILGALGAASRENPKKLLVISDGLANTGDLDLNRSGFDSDPKMLADTIKNAKSLPPTLQGQTVVWSGLGETGTVLPQALRTSLEGVWTAVLGAAGASVTFDARVGGSATPAPSGMPADEVKLPKATETTNGCGTEITVPTALLFSPNSAALQQDTGTVLSDVANTLKGHADWVAVVAGHTANYGTQEGQLKLSRQRAEAVAGRLVQLGVDRSRLTTEGYGSSRPAVPEIVGNVHDEAAAAKNRRVVIVIGPKGCAR